MILLSQWYEPEDETRLAELREARQRNESLFEEVFYLDGQEKRWGYGDFFALAEEKFPGKACVLANTDIAFGTADTVRALSEACEKNRLVTLTRWEDSTSPNMLGHFCGTANMQGHYRFFSGSQDSWAFIAGGLPELKALIPLGAPGCDNAICGWAAKQGCQVFNPALDLKTWHLHANQSRPDRDPVYGWYGYPELTTVNVTGAVAGHTWPLVEGIQTADWEIIKTWQP